MASVSSGNELLNLTQSALRRALPATLESRVPPPMGINILFNFFLISTILIPRGFARKSISTAVVVLLLSWLPFWGTGNFQQDFTFGSGVALMLLQYVDFILLTTVETDLHKKVASEEFNESMSWGKKLQWSASLWGTYRGIGWTHEARNMRPAGPSKKYAFLKLHALRFLRFYILSDVIQTYQSGLLQAQSIGDTSPFLTSSYSWQIANTVIHTTRLISTVKFAYSAGAFLHVLLGMSKPEEWPPAYGSLADAYTVGRFWGCFWHQFMQRPLRKLSSFCATNILRLPKSSVAWRMAFVVTAFFLSGVVHASASLYARHQDSGEFVFFMGQGLAVVVEEVVIGLAKHCGIAGQSFLWRLPGYVWVFFAFTLQAKRAVAGQAASGMWANSDVPFSIMQAGYSWIPESWIIKS